MTYGLARHNDPDTSHEAAKSVSVNRIEKAVLEAFWRSDNGLIAEEIAQILKLPLNTVTPRIAPLVRKGFLVPAGKKKASSGRNQRIHKWISDQ